MKRFFLFFFLIFSQISWSFGQQVTVSGYISDEASGEKLVGANIFELGTNVGISSSNYGFYSLSFPKSSTLRLVCSYIGFQTDTIVFQALNDTILNIELSQSINLKTVEVTESINGRIIDKTQLSELNIPIAMIQELPAILGETDVLKVLQLMPGVQSGNEGFAGLYVRGGSPDQNLILLDDVPVYNSTHVLGIFSIFNTDAIQNVSLIKGGFPARYGGRLSSVLDIKTKEGNLKEWHGEGGVSLLSSKFTLEGPLKKEKTAVIISGRRSYVDLLLKPIVQSGDIDNLTTYFYDLNFKIQHKINNKHRLFFGAYAGQDLLNLAYKNDDEIYGSGINWQNRIGSFRWNYQINKKLFSNTTLYFSQYKLDIESYFENKTELERIKAVYQSGIKDAVFKVDFNYFPTNQHNIKFGGSIIRHQFNTGALARTIEINTLNQDTTIGTTPLPATEYYTFIEDDFEISDKFSANLGVHFSGFHVENKNYYSIQPRVSLKYDLAKHTSIKAAFATMTQYINLLTSESLGLPTDLWMPSTANVLPQQSWQAVFGIAHARENGVEVSIEGFYKKLENVISYVEGANFLFNLDNNWEKQITQGDGTVYGTELLMQKKTGKTTGWIGYTLSWNWRQFDEINSGKRFPFRYDRRHDISIVCSHKFNEKITLSGSWIYGTGNAISVPTSTYSSNLNQLRTFDDVALPTPQRFVIDGKNEFRMSAAHRLDASISFFKKKPKFERKWIISVYNVYSHINPYFAIIDEEFKTNPNTGLTEGKFLLKEIGFLPILPSVAYHIKF